MQFLYQKKSYERMSVGILGTFSAVTDTWWGA